jgi:hypothetical protein
LSSKPGRVTPGIFFPMAFSIPWRSFSSSEVTNEIASPHPGPLARDPRRGVRNRPLQ